MKNVFLSIIRLVSITFFLIACGSEQVTVKSQFNGEQAETANTNNLVSISALRANKPQTKLVFEKALYQHDLYRGDLLSYRSDGLKMYVLLNTPTSLPSEQGFPLLIFGHGFHPEPKKYAISQNGEVSRPGDYYRNVPEAFAEHGFAVLSPDYRGHNVSEGFEFTQTSYLASSYYARDVLSLLHSLDSLEGIDLNRIYYMGHSMGVDVGLKVLLASDVIRAASLWSGVIASTPEQVLYYEKSSLAKSTSVDSAQFKQMRAKIENIYLDKAPAVGFADVDPIAHIQDLDVPLMVHHGTGDRGAPYLWSESFVSRMLELQKDVTFYFYDTDEHLFSGAMRAEVVQRDVEFFNAHQ